MSDDEQSAIVDSPPAERTVVLAGAGTGKTETAVRRLVSLAEQHNLVPGVELLVLSFSRAAVREARRRLRVVRPGLAAVRFTTIDSFASRLLRLYSDSDDWLLNDYAGRIRDATALVRSSDLPRRELEAYRHVIVDEVQDLVGDRAEFVLIILATLPAESGFTVLGDPAQGIYDFELKSSTAKVTARELLRRILDLAPAPHLRTLTHNHRARSKVADGASALGSSMRQSLVDEGVVGSAQCVELGDLIRGLDSYDSDMGGRLLARRALAEGLTGAVLCRFNSQALVVSQTFAATGVPHRLQPPADRPVVGAWLARTFRGYEFASISRGQFERLLETVDEPRPDASSAWIALRRLTGASASELPVRWITGNLRNGRVDGPLVDVPDADIVVSSIHRAKGLEWDLVLICGLDRGAVEEDPALAYVALTRTRDEVYVLAEPDTRGMTMAEQPDGRWVRSQSWDHRLLQLQLLDDDVHRVDPVGAWMYEGDCREAQTYLSSTVAPDDPVDLVRIRASVDGEPQAVYRIDHKGVSIGVTSEVLSRALWRNVSVGGTLARGFPDRLTGGRVYAIETVPGSQAAGRTAGLGSSGLWLAPRLHGLADVAWETVR